MLNVEKLQDESFYFLKIGIFKKVRELSAHYFLIASVVLCHTILYVCQWRFKSIQCVKSIITVCQFVSLHFYTCIHTFPSVDPLRDNMSLLKSEVNLGRKTMDD